MACDLSFQPFCEKTCQGGAFYTNRLNTSVSTLYDCHFCVCFAFCVQIGCSEENGTLQFIRELQANFVIAAMMKYKILLNFLMPPPLCIPILALEFSSHSRKRSVMQEVMREATSDWIFSSAWNTKSAAAV